MSKPRCQEEKRFLKYGFKGYSQNDKDGIIQEFFCRIGTTNKIFVEIGVSNGLENNTLYLLLQGWCVLYQTLGFTYHVAWVFLSLLQEKQK